MAGILPFRPIGFHEQSYQPPSFIKCGLDLFEEELPMGSSTAADHDAKSLSYSPTQI